MDRFIDLIEKNIYIYNSNLNNIYIYWIIYQYIYSKYM